MTTGMIGNIQHYSIHDGPGIRSTVFLKGCPLACLWCHNPENIAFGQQIIWQQEKCIGCGDCKGIHDYPQSEICPALAIEALGKQYTVDHVLQTLLKDAPFYENSGGGVTLSGGEPLAQPQFAQKLLAALKQEGIHTAVDTSGYALWSVVQACAKHTDLFLYDIKHLDAQKHRQLTGVDNSLILDNLHKLANSKARIWLRIPVLPGINDDEQHIRAIGALGRKLGIKDIYLLPYHHMAMGKYAKLGLTYQLPALAQPGEEHLHYLQSLL